MKYPIIESMLDKKTEPYPEDIKKKETEFFKAIGMYDMPFEKSSEISDLYNDLINSIELLRFRDGFIAANDLSKELI